MYWQTRFNRQPRNQKLEEKITELHKEHKDFGYRRMHGMLIKLGYHVNKKRVQRIMQKLKFQVSSFTRKSRKYSSYKGKVGNIAPNRIHRRFRTSIPHQKITTDTSEFKYYEVDKSGRMVIKKLYLDPFMDMYNSEIISYSISRNPSSQAIVSALTQAIEVTNDCKYRRTFHSDRGWAYQMKVYNKMLTKNKIFQSMSRKGNCYDNSVMENFFGLLKSELLYLQSFDSIDHFKAELIDYLHYYNFRRIKAKLKGLPPAIHRQQALLAA